MKAIENILERLDDFFEGKKQSEFYIVIFMIVAVFGYLSYGLLIPITEKMLKKDMNRKMMLENQIAAHEAYIASVSREGDHRYRIKSLEREIAKLKIRFRDTRELNEYFDYQIQTLSEMLFNEQNWAKFLDSIAGIAKRHHVHIRTITNQFVKNDKSFGHVLEIGITCQGKYRNIMAFLNSIEESDLVVDVSRIAMESGKEINASMKVSVWGINY